MRRRRRGEDLKIKVLKLKGRTNFVFRWTDPTTGHSREETSSIEARPSFRKRAIREAAKRESELLDECNLGDEVLWSEFVKRYTQEELSSLAVKSRRSWGTACGHLEKCINPLVLSDVSASSLSKMAAMLRRQGKAEASIESYMATIRPAIKWAYDIGLIDEVPKFPKMKRAKGKSKHRRSRPINGEEYDRFLAAIPKVRKRDPEKWVQFTRGLWYSGLRVDEARRLSWKVESDFAIVLNGQQSLFRIRGEGEKGAKDRLLPVAPEFVQFLEAEFPDPNKRKGNVFALSCATSTIIRNMIEVGKRSGIIVNSDGKCASAHDLRRSFATRWAARLKPIQLKELMRHRSIETTMKYYVEVDAQELSDELWSHVLGGILGGTPNSQTENQVAKEPNEEL